MERYVTYEEVWDAIKKVFAKKGYTNKRKSFTYDLKEYLLVVSFYKSRWCGPWGGTLYGDMGLIFYEMHPNGIEHRHATWSDFQSRIFETDFNTTINMDKMRKKLLNSLKICDAVIKKGAWKLFKKYKLYYGLYPRETVPFIYEKTGIKLR